MFVMPVSCQCLNILWSHSVFLSVHIKRGLKVSNRFWVWQTPKSPERVYLGQARLTEPLSELKIHIFFLFESIHHLPHVIGLRSNFWQNVDCYCPSWLEPQARGGRCDLLTSCNGMWPREERGRRWKGVPGGQYLTFFKSPQKILF